MKPVQPNDFRVGRDAPLGQALRRYWTPACLSSDIPDPDSDPYRVRLLGEHLVAFRDSAGRVGLLEEACPHRKASLVFGHNAEGGLRCLWHQWKFAVDGEVLETPNVDDCDYRHRVRAKAYPVREAGGFIWTYLGPPELEPPFPHYHWFDAPADNVMVVPVDLDCNFVYPLDGLLDSSHVALLHVDAVKTVADGPSADRVALQRVSAPRLEVEMTDFGFHYAAIRDIQADGRPARQVRITTYAAPYLVFIAGGNIHLSVPQDDTHTRFYNIAHTPEDLQRWTGLDSMLATLGLHPDQLEKGGIASRMPDIGPLGRRNVFAQDRDGMRRGETYSGVPGLTVEDAIMTVSAASMPQHCTENLVPADVAIARMRRWLNEAAARVAAGEPAPATRPKTEFRSIRATAALLTGDEDWHGLVPGHQPLEPRSARRPAFS